MNFINIKNIQNNSKKNLVNDYSLEQKHIQKNDDDNSLSHLYQRLSEAKKLRKIRENGVKLLNGQILRLKEESQKIKQKQQINNKKENDKLLIKERKANQKKEIIENNQKLEKDLMKLKTQNYMIKKERDNRIINAKQKLIIENRIKAKLIKKEKEDIYIAKIMNELNEINSKKSQAEYIKNQISQKKEENISDENDINGLNENFKDNFNYNKSIEEEILFQIENLLNHENEILKRISLNNEIQEQISNNIRYFEK